MRSFYRQTMASILLGLLVICAVVLTGLLLSLLWSWMAGEKSFLPTVDQIVFWMTLAGLCAHAAMGIDSATRRRRGNG